MNRIISARTEGTFVLATFQDGTQKKYDIRTMYDIFPQLKELEKDEELFKKISVDTGGYGVSWNDDLDIDAEEIWENGEKINTVEVDCIIKTGLILANTRENLNMTQKELARKTGIYQGDISKIERGVANPSLSTLKRLADGMNMQLKIEFIPTQTRN